MAEMSVQTASHLNVFHIKLDSSFFSFPDDDVSPNIQDIAMFSSDVPVYHAVVYFGPQNYVFTALAFRT